MADKRRFYIVWNEGRTEGFITDDADDAKQALRGRFRNPSSALGNAFFDCYSDDDIGLQALDIEPLSKP